MRQAACIVSLISLCALAAAGCGGGTHTDSASSTSAARTTNQPAAPVVLEDAVRRAVNENHALLTRALLTNRVPTNPEGTAGPALADLRRSVAERQRQKVRVRVLADSFKVLAMQLDPSYTTASATVLDVQRVQPTDLHGHPHGKVSAAREHVRLELHRVGETDRFVVWKASLLK